MSATVGPQRSRAPQGEVVISAGVRGVHWVDAARLWNWAAGRGSVDVPSHCPYAVVTSGTTSTFRYRVRPRYSTVAYAYQLRLRATGGADEIPVDVDVSIPSGGTTYAARADFRQRVQTYSFIVERGSQSSALTELTFDLDHAGADTVIVESVSIVALPRLVLSSSNDDLGIDLDLFLRNAPIRAASVQTQAALRVDNLRDAARRNGSFQFSRGTDDPWSFTGAATDLFADDFPLLGRYIYDGDIARTLHAYALCKCSDGTTAGTVSIDTTSGGAGVTSNTVPAGTTSWTWIDVGPFDVDAEDQDDTCGRRSAVDDLCQVQCERTAGAGSVQIASISILDEAE